MLPLPMVYIYIIPKQVVVMVVVVVVVVRKHAASFRRSRLANLLRHITRIAATADGGKQT